MKTFADYLAETEEEFEYHLYSVINMHTPEMLAKLGYALRPHGLIAAEPLGVQTKADSNLEFVDYPFEHRFVTKLILNRPISSRHAELAITVFTGTSDKGFNLLDKDGNEVIVRDALAAEIDPMTGDQAQKLVGDKRVTSLMDDFRSFLGATKAEEVKIEVVTEGFVCNHATLSKAIGSPVRKGFYVAEAMTSGKFRVVGPFATQPDNYDFRACPVGKLVETKVLKAHTQYILEAEETRVDASGDEAGVAEVEITDQDTGKVYTVVVSTTDNVVGRQQAIDVLSKKLGLAKTKLIPTKPEA